MENMLSWINIPGLVIMAILMIPNAVYARKHPEGFENLWNNKVVETLEQIGRFACFGLMVVVIPGCGFSLANETIFTTYCVVSTLLLLAYCLVWAFCFNSSTIFRALALSILPSLLFIACGVISGYTPLLLAAFLFAICHITLSYMNAKSLNGV